MKKILLAFALYLPGFASFAQTTFKADKMHSQIKFDITHMGVSTVSGAFTDFTASVTATAADFSDALFEMSAKTESINTGIDPRDKHLASADFFDAASFPTVTFKSNGIKKAGKDKYTVTGDLTMHGVTKPVTMELWYRGTVANPRSKADVTGLKITGKINRMEFGIGPKYPATALSEEVTITADGEFSK